MSKEINYKAKYIDLKQKFINSVDTAFRLGYEQGMQAASQQQAQQMQQQQMAAQAQPGQSGQEQPEESAAPEANPQGSELDQHIQKLESMLGSSDGGVSKEELQKAISDLKFGLELKKSSEAITGIAKALHKPSFTVGQIASHNLSDAGKKSVSMQEKIVSDIMKSWSNEEKKASTGIKSILGIEGLVKGE